MKKKYNTNEERIEANRIRCKLWNEANKKRLSEYRENNKENKKDYNLINKDMISDQKKLYYQKNKVKINKRNKERKQTDLIFKLKNNVSSLIRESIKYKGYSKNSKTIDILGCSIESFKLYLESKFESWMNWSNKGNWNGIPTEPNVSWDIDHIVPMSTAKNESDIIRLNHWSNLQPLCSYNNRYVKRG